MRRTHSFTLIEILVVIAIIGILAGLIFPALNRARAVSQATQCLNNKRSLGQTVNLYALDNDRRIPLIMSSKPYSWYFRGYLSDQSDANDERPSGKVYMSFPAMRCPLAKVEKNGSDPQEKVSAIFDTGNTGSGWWSSSSTGTRTMQERFGEFRIKRGSNYDYSIRLIRDTSNLALFVDAFLEKKDGKDPLKSATWRFDYQGSFSDDCGRITLLHQDKATIGYADGHADQQDKNGLKKMGLSNFYNGGFQDAR